MTGETELSEMAYQALTDLKALKARVPEGLVKVLPKHRGGYACDRHYVPIWDAAKILQESIE